MEITEKVKLWYYRVVNVTKKLAPALPRPFFWHGVVLSVVHILLGYQMVQSLWVSRTISALLKLEFEGISLVLSVGDDSQGPTQLCNCGKVKGNVDFLGDSFTCQVSGQSCRGTAFFQRAPSYGGFSSVSHCNEYLVIRDWLNELCTSLMGKNNVRVFQNEMWVFVCLFVNRNIYLQFSLSPSQVFYVVWANPEFR